MSEYPFDLGAIERESGSVTADAIKTIADIVLAGLRADGAPRRALMTNATVRDDMEVGGSITLENSNAVQFENSSGTPYSALQVNSNDNTLLGNLNLNQVRILSRKTTTGDPTGAEGLLYWNTVDNVLKMYCDGAWRTLDSW